MERRHYEMKNTIIIVGTLKQSFLKRVLDGVAIEHKNESSY
jgi:hypothetical protein